MRIMMPIGATTLAGAFAMTLAMSGSASAASAIQKECSTKYQAAKSANTLNGMTYNQYYKQCAADAKAEKTAPSATPAATAPAAPTTAPKPTPTTTAPMTPAAPAPAPTTTATAPAAAPKAPVAPAAAGAAVFPTAVSAQFSKETAGKARMHTCLAQYNANKTNNANGGLKWIEKGGGYYSQCNTRLKG